jgi:hypothetical protein
VKEGLFLPPLFPSLIDIIIDWTRIKSAKDMSIILYHFLDD